MAQSNLMMRWIEEADSRELVLARKMVTPAAERDDREGVAGLDAARPEILGLLRRCCEFAHLR